MSRWIDKRIRITAGVLLAFSLSLLTAANSVLAQVPDFFPEAQLSPQVAVDEIDNMVRGQFERAKQLLADERWDDAIDVISRLSENDGDKLVALKPTDQRKPLYMRYIPLREYCHQWFTGLAVTAPEALRVYRGRVDPLAERWFKQAKAERSDAPLERIVDQFFASSFTDDALLLLADAAIERGEYTAARGWLQQFSPKLRSPAAGLALWLPLRSIDWKTDGDAVRNVLEERQGAVANTLAYPDTDLNVADALARLVLISILEGAGERANVELEVLRHLYPEAEGHLAGRSGNWAALLADMREQSRAWEPLAASRDWPTFAGNVSRNSTAARPIDIEGQPLWSVALRTYSGAKDRLASSRIGRIGEDVTELLSYHPVVVGPFVFVADTKQVRAFRLANGQPAWDTIRDAAEEKKQTSDLGTIYKTNGNDGLARPLPFTGVPRFTLNALDDRLYVKMGSPITRENEEFRPANDDRGFLLGLDLAAQGRVFVRIALSELGLGSEWAFEGAPVSDGSYLFVALRRRDSVRDQAHVASFDLRTGGLVWRRSLSAAEPPYRNKIGISHGLLSLKDGTLYYNTNLGAVAAIAARDGRIRWLTTYPRASYQTHNPDKTDRYFQRDLNPCVLYQDLVVTAPADCDRIFALDAVTGQLIWTTDGDRANDVMHLLGVGADRLIASGDYLYWFDVYSGNPVGQYPPAQKEGPGFLRPTPQGYGRGLLAGDQVWWPTHDKIKVFQQETRNVQGGWQPIAGKEIDLKARNVSGGNLLIVHNLLLIATGSKLTAFQGE